MTFLNSIWGLPFKSSVILPRNWGAWFLFLLFQTGASHVFGQTHTEMKVFSDSFISPAFESTEKSNYQFVGAILKTDASSEDNIRMEISGGVAVGSPLMNYLNIAELYFKNPQNLSENFYIGRKKMRWSELDSRWNLGVWQPVYKWNPLAPEEQGLTGLFWQIDKPSYTFVLFASPVYFPSQGPNFEIKDGGFVKGNPWFREPPPSVRIWDQATEMQYHFDRPNDSQIVMQSSYGAKLSFGENKNFRTQLSYLYGPDNVLALGYRGSLDLSTLKGNVELQPQVFFHSLAGLDFSAKYENWKVGLGGTFDHPAQDKIFDSAWSQPLFEDAFLLSPFFQWDNGLWSISVFQLDIYGGGVKEVGENLANTPLTNLYPFQQAQMLAVELNQSISPGRKIYTKVSFTHSDKNDFDLIRFNARFRYSQNWAFLGEMQILRAGAINKNNINDIAELSNNDRLMVGVSYAL